MGHVYEKIDSMLAKNQQNMLEKAQDQAVFLRLWCRCQPEKYQLSNAKLFWGNQKRAYTNNLIKRNHTATSIVAYKSSDFVPKSPEKPENKIAECASATTRRVDYKSSSLDVYFSPKKKFILIHHI